MPLSPLLLFDVDFIKSCSLCSRVLRGSLLTPLDGHSLQTLGIEPIKVEPAWKQKKIELYFSFAYIST